MATPAIQAQKKPGIQKGTAFLNKKTNEKLVLYLNRWSGYARPFLMHEDWPRLTIFVGDWAMPDCKEFL